MLVSRVTSLVRPAAVACVLLAAAVLARAQVFTVRDVSPAADRGQGGVGAVDAAGNAMFLWSVTGPTGGSLGQRTSRYEAATDTFSAPTELGSAPPSGFGHSYAATSVVMGPTADATAVGVHGYFFEIGFSSLKDIIVSRYSAATGRWGAFTTLSPVTSVEDLSSPAAVVDAEGTVTAMWWQATCQRCRAYTLYAARAPAGGTWTTRVVTGNMDFNDWTPALAVAANGDVLGVVVRNVASVRTLQAVRYSKGSDTWDVVDGPQIPVGLNDEKALAMTPDGRALVAWRTATGLDAASFTLGSGLWGPVQPVSNASARSVASAIDQSGIAVVIWQSGSSANSRVTTRRFSSSTGSWDPPVTLSTSGSGGSRGRVVIGDDNVPTAVWHEEDSTTRRLMASRFDSTAGQWSGPIEITRVALPGSVSLGGLFADGAGGSRIAWTRNTTDQNGIPRAIVQTTRWLPGAGAPGAPRGLRATVSNHTVTLTWSEPASGSTPTSYTLIGRTTIGGPVLATVPMGTGTSFSLTAPNGTFALTVQASNSLGMGPESAPVTIAVPQAVTQAPEPPQGLVATVAGTSATFNWAPAPNGGPAEGHVLLAGLTPAFVSPIASLPLGAGTSVVVPGVPPGTYYVRVLATNALGTSASSNEVSLTVNGAAPPAVPILDAPNVNGNTVTLSWRAGAGAAPTSYTVMASVASGGPPIATVPLTSTTATFSGVPNGTYYVRITASNAAGTSAPSNEASMSVGPVTGSTLLPLVNERRQRAGLPPLVEEPSWTVGAQNHADYIIRNNGIGTGNGRSFQPENASQSGYTTSGNDAATNSLQVLSYSPGILPRNLVSYWARGAFTSLLMLDPRLQRTGGGYKVDPYTGTSAVLDVLRGRNPAMVVGPTTFPRAGAAVVAECPERTSYVACAGDDYPPVVGFCNIPSTNPYTYPTFGLPLWIQFGGSVNPVVSAATLTTGSTSLPVCTVTADTYTAPGAPATQALGRSILRDRGAVVLVPPSTLPAGRTYTATVTVNGQQYQWTFDVVEP